MFREYKLQVPVPLSSRGPAEPAVKAFTARGGPLESESRKWSFLGLLCSCGTGPVRTGVSL